MHVGADLSKASGRRRRFSNEIGPAIARIRYRRGLTQDQVAARAQIAGYDINRQTIANLESRRVRVTDRHVAMLVRILKCSLEELFGNA